jgi:AcrR family transcriptional regulator
MPFRVKISYDADPPDGLRSRKRVKTRAAVEQAALALFAEQGYDATTIDQITERAEISTTTFFRYYPSKADVIVVEQDQSLSQLREVIATCPLSESDMCAMRNAILRIWAPIVDPERTMLFAKAVSRSPVLRGLFNDLIQDWRIAMAEGLAARKGLDRPDERTHVLARVGMAAFSNTIESWIENECKTDVGEILRRNFDHLLA